MHRAAKEGDLETVKNLIERGVSVDCRDHLDNTPIHYAAMYGRQNIVQILIDNQCNVNLRCSGVTPVHDAALGRHKDVVDLLLQSGAQVNGAAESEKSNLLHVAATNGWVDVVQLINEERARMHRAAKEGDLETVKNLIEQGVSVDCRDYIDNTPLHYAAMYGRQNIVQILIDNKCNVNLRCSGATPVHDAALEGHKDVVELLLQSGARVNFVAESGMSTLLHVAARNGWVDVVQLIIEEAEGLNAADESGQTPLMKAAMNGHKDVAALLIRAGADINRIDALKQQSALHFAVQGHNTNEDVAALLVRAGVDVNRIDKFGQSALHLGIERSNIKVVKVLLEVEGLALDLQDQRGNTPLHIACRCCRYKGVFQKVVQQMLAAGADASLKNDEGKIALTYCRHIEEFRLFEDCFKGSALISKNHVQNYVGLCTQLIVNRFHNQSLRPLYNDPYFAKKLPRIEKFKLSARQMHEVENFVKCDIQTNTFCNIVKARPIVLCVLCVESLLALQTAMKRSASMAYRKKLRKV